MKKLYILLIAALVSGCALFGDLQSQGVDKLVDVATEYCANTDQAWRDQFRTEFNEKFGGTAAITCPET